MFLICGIKLIFDTVDLCDFVINKSNPMLEVQGGGNSALQNTLTVSQSYFEY